MRGPCCDATLGSMSAAKVWLISVLVALVWVVGAALVTRAVWEPGSIKHTLVATVPAVLIVRILRAVLQRRGRKLSEGTV